MLMMWTALILDIVVPIAAPSCREQPTPSISNYEGLVLRSLAYTERRKEKDDATQHTDWSMHHKPHA